jgi:hypothetical protein
LSKDDIYNLIELAYHLNGTVISVDLFPNMCCVVGLPEILQDFNDLLELSSQEDQVVCHYDTTFKLGDFWVSPLSYRHILFKEKPTITLAYLIHEKKDEKFHTRFFTILKEKIPQLTRKNFAIVLDREAAITNAIKKTLPNVSILHCWNHIKQDIKHWLNAHMVVSEAWIYQYT